jgi:hypothetical protein
MSTKSTSKLNPQNSGSGSVKNLDKDKDAQVLPKPEPNNKQKMTYKTTEIQLKSEKAADNPIIVKRFHYAVSSFIARCHLFPLKGDGDEQDHNQLFLDVLRATKDILLMLSKKDGTLSMVWKSISHKFMHVVKKWKALIQRANILFQPGGSNKEIRKLVDDFTDEFEEFVSLINSYLGGNGKNTRLMVTEYEKIIQKQTKKKKKPTDIAAIEVDNRILRANSTPQLHEKSSPEVDDDEVTIVPSPTDSIKSQETLARKRSKTDSNLKNSNGGSKKVDETPEWDIKKMFSELQELKLKHEQDIREKKEKTQQLKRQSFLAMQELQKLNIQQDLAKNDITEPNYPAPILTSKAKGNLAAESTTLKRSKTDSSKHAKVTSPIISPTSPVIKVKSKPPLFTFPKSSDSDLNGTTTSKTSGTKLTRAKTLMSSSSSPDLSYQKNEIISSHGDGHHKFRKITMMEDLRHAFKSLFRKSHTKASTKGVEFREYRTYTQNEKCRICEDSFSLTDGKVRCVLCNLVLHQNCREYGNLNMFHCSERISK